VLVSPPPIRAAIRGTNHRDAVRSATPRIATNASAEAKSRRRRRREIMSRIVTYRWLTRQARRPSVTINIAPITMINEPSRRRRMLRSAKYRWPR